MNAIPIRIASETPDERAERLADEAQEEAREWALERFGDWQRWNDPNDEADFSDWLVGRAQKHLRDWERYDAALLWFERAPRLIDLSRGQRAYVRGGV